MTSQDLKSSIVEKGEIVNQIVLFKGGEKRTYQGILTETIVQNEYTRFDLVTGERWYVNDKNVNTFVVLPYKKQKNK